MSINQIDDVPSVGPENNSSVIEIMIAQRRVVRVWVSPVALLPSSYE
jgi:hypothetical protein